MLVKINKKKVIEVLEPFIIVQDGMLYNTKTRKNEGVDGDIIEFIWKRENGNINIGGTIDGYSCGNNIKLRGTNQVYENIEDVHITHISCVEESEMEALDELSASV